MPECGMASEGREPNMLLLFHILGLFGSSR